MPNTLNNNGLTIEQLDEIIAKFNAGYQAIYGLDINLDSNSPDGQQIGIYAQQAEDGLQLTLAVYNNFDPDTAIGVSQDRLYYINGLIRKGASYSYMDIDITVDRALTLQGLDTNANLADGQGYTVTDNTGTNWILLTTQSPSAAGTNSYTFRAQNIGVINSNASTVILPVTVVLGVTAINNPTSATTVGEAGETDAEFRLRRSKSFAIKGTGAADSMFSNISNLPDVVDCRVYQNFTAITDANGIPPHSIWVIVEGGAPAAIAQQIYAQHGYGNMKGSQTYDILTIQDQIFTARYDRPIPESLYLRFNLKPTKTGQTFDLTSIANYIAQYTSDNDVYKIGGYADTANLTFIATLGIMSTGGQAVPLELEISDDDIAWTDYLDPTTLQHKFVLDATNITITEV